MFLFTCTGMGLLPAHGEEESRRYAGVYLHDVTKFDQKDGVFDADFELWVKWRGEFDPDTLTIANVSQMEREPFSLDQEGDWHTARKRVRGTLRGQFNVARFPFDEQTLRVELDLPERLGELAPDLAGSGMSQQFSVSGWDYEPNFYARVKPLVYHSDLGAIEGEGFPTKIRRAAFEVTLHRPLLTAATKLFLPLLVILLVAFVPLFIHPEKLEVRASIGVTALLACFAFHFAVSDAMPDVTYITLAETLFLISYAVCAALLFVSVAVAAIHDRGHVRAHKALDRASLFLLPLAFVATAFVAVPPVPTESTLTLVSEKTPRPVSDREVLRVGASSLTNPNYGLVARAAYWGTSRQPFGGTPFPVLVSEVPGITNRSLRFLANGQLEVTWRLLPDLRWSDGAPLTADDLLFALEVDNDGRIASKQVVGPQELVVLYKERVAVALREILPWPRHVLYPVYEAASAGGDEKAGYAAVRTYRDENALPSAGAYYVKEWQVGESAVLEANPYFQEADSDQDFQVGVNRPPSIQRIEIHCYPENELVSAFERGEIDMISPNAVTPEAAQTCGKRQPDALTVQPSDVLLYLHADLSNPWLAQPAFRKALLQSFDRETLRDHIFGEAAESAPIAHLPVAGELPDGVVKTAYDPEAAKRTIERIGASGARIPLIHETREIELEVVMQLVRDASAIGIILQPTPVPSRWTFFRQNQHGGLLLMQQTSLREHAPEKFWGLPRRGTHYDRSLQSAGAFDQTIASLVEREERALYPERREQIRDTLFVRFSERLPLLPLFFLADHMLVDPELKGWNGGTGNSFGSTVENWYFEAPVEATAETLAEAESF